MITNKQTNPALRKYFSKINNEIIINPKTDSEYNVTMNFEECDYCQKEIHRCGEGGTGMYCKGFEMVENFVYRR